MKTRHILIASVASLLAATTTYAQNGTFTDLTVNGLFQAKGPNNTNLISTDGGNVTMDFSGANGYLTLKGGDYDVAGFLAKPFDMATFYPATPNGAGPNGAFYFYDSYFTDGGVNKSVTDTYFTGDRNYGRWYWMTMVPGNGGYQSRMILQATGTLELFTQSNQFTPAISINPGNSGAAGITINGSQVLTQSSAGSQFVTRSNASSAFVGLLPMQTTAIASPNATIANAALYSIALGDSASVSPGSGITLADGGIAIGKSAASQSRTSIAFGQNALASSPNSFGSVAIGSASQSTGRSSAALGATSKAYGDYSYAIGYQAKSYGSGSISIGKHAVAGMTTRLASDATNAIAIGIGSQVQASGSVALGQNTWIPETATAATVVGNAGRAYGNFSTAIGTGAESWGYRQIVLGQYSVFQGDPYGNSNLPSDHILIVANGNSETDRSNALTIRKDAGTAIGTGVTSNAAAQLVAGRYNDTTTDATTTPQSVRTNGVFIVGSGTASAPKNAMRILDDGTILINPSGDISMGEFTTGEKP
jgi:hypothetical protein